jgi:exosortase
VATGAAFLVLFAGPMADLAKQWWTDPNAGHGLLLAPIALYLAWRSGVRPDAKGQPVLGLCLLVVSVLLRYVGALAAELFTMRTSLVGAIIALIVFAWGARQLVRWWLPLTLVVLSVPLPTVVLNSAAFPLQLEASKMGAALLAWRQIPVLLDGNVIRLPGHTLFVTEACSGLRSLAALVALGVLIAGLWLKKPPMRLLLIAAAIPVAILLNGIRVFLTGFLVFFVDPKLGEGFMHLTEGWIIFVFAFAILGGLAWVLVRLERLWGRAA